MRFVIVKKNIRIIIMFGLIIGSLTFFQQKSFGFQAPTLPNQDQLDYDLLKCVEAGDLQCATQKINSGASPDARSADGTTALMYAINSNQPNAVHIIKLLFDNNVSPNIQNQQGTTALMVASEQNKVPAVKKLLKKKADLNLKRNDGVTALMIAMNKKHHDIVSMLFDGGAIPGIEQLRLFYNLQMFVDKYNDRNDNFKNILKNSKGHCAGLTKIWLYSKWASENNIGSYTYEWFLETIKNVAAWDGKSDLDDKTIQNFNQFLSMVTLFQDPNYYDLTIPQVDFKNLLTKSLLPTESNELNEEYTIASTVTVKRLEVVLDKIVRNNKLITICSLDPMAHAVALYKNNNNYHYYDPNAPEGEIVTISVEEVAKKIAESYHFDQVNFPAIGFAIYDFSNSNSFSAKTPTELICLNPPYFFEEEKCFINNNIMTYPSQESILNNIKPFANETALFPAASVGCLHSTEYFLHQNIPIDATLAKNKMTSLMIASMNGHFDVVKKYLIEKANPNLQNMDGKTALMFATQGGFADITNESLNHNANPDIQDNNGMTALMIACNFGLIDIVEQLLSKKADPNIKTNNDRTALMLAANKNYVTIIEKLIDGGANPDLQFKDKVTALMIASNTGNTEAVEKLLEKRANPDLQNIDDNTALMIALLSKNPKIARILLENGANPNLQRKTDGATALMIAAELGYINTIKKLLERRADPNLHLNADGSTALMIALLSNHPDIAIELLNKGADTNLQKNDGTTALMIALFSKHPDIAIKMIDGGAKPNLQRKDGVTALMIAAQLGYIDVVKKLLKKCADPNLTIHTNGATALMHATQPAIVNLLRNAAPCIP